MSRGASEIGELSKRIESLGTRQKVKLLEGVLTPEIELRFAMEQIARRSRHVPARVLDRAADGAIQVERLLRQIDRLTEEQQCELLEALLLKHRRAELGWGMIKRIRSTLPVNRAAGQMRRGDSRPTKSTTMSREEARNLAKRIHVLPTAEQVRLLSWLLEVEGKEVTWSEVERIQRRMGKLEVDDEELERVIVEAVREVRHGQLKNRRWEALIGEEDAAPKGHSGRRLQARRQAAGRAHRPAEGEP